MTKLIHADVTEKARCAYYTTFNQVEYEIYYKNVKVGEHITDTELDDKVVLEYKAVPNLLPHHHAQLFSYLKVSGKEVGLLFNFGGEEPEIERKILTAAYRKNGAIWQPEKEVKQLKYPELTLEVRRAMWEVGQTLGTGLVQRIYGNAAFVELKSQGIVCEPIKKLTIFHDEYEIGEIPFRHIIVESRIVLVPVAISDVKPTLIRNTRMVMAQKGLQFAMIANFACQPVEVRYLW